MILCANSASDRNLVTRSIPARYSDSSMNPLSSASMSRNHASASFSVMDAHTPVATLSASAASIEPLPSSSTA